MRLRSVAAVVGVLVGVLVVWLGSPVTARAVGDAAAGKTLSLACQACHAAIAPTSDTPHLAGQREGYIAKQLKAFKAGDRKQPVMTAIAGLLSDADMANVAAYWASLAPGSDTTVSPEVTAIKKSHMTFPQGFPNGFVAYLTTNKEEEHGISKSYINTVGFNAVKAGKPLPDGTQILVVNYAAKLDADKKPVLEKDGSWATDKIMGYAGMEAKTGWGKDIPELIRNANWNYQVFGPDKTPRAELNQALCLACHKPTASTSYVFLLKDIQAKAGAK
jgi:cytochrome c553